MRQRCRPGQPKPTSIQQQHSGHRLTVHKAQAAQQQQHHGRPRDGRQLSIHAMQTMCLCYHRPTNHVVRFRSSGCGGTGVSNSAIASNFSETLRHCTALLLAAGCCWLLLCCPSFGHAVGCIQDDRRQTQVGLLLFFATLCHHSPPSFTFLYSHPHSTPAHASAKAVSATVPLVRQKRMPPPPPLPGWSWIMLLPGVSQQLINLLTNALPSRGFSTLYMQIHFTIALYTLKRRARTMRMMSRNQDLLSHTSSLAQISPQRPCCRKL